MTSIADARADFAAAEAWTYLDTSSTGILPRPTTDAVAAFLEDCNRNAATKSAWAEAVAGARAGLAGLIGADPEDVCLTGNTTEGVNAVAGGLGWQPGDNVVIPAELEHPANIYPWLAARERGLEVRMVPPSGQAIDTDALIAAADDRTRAIAVSSVTFVPGFRTDLAALGRACRERDIFLLVDATQSLGALETDVEALAIDGLAVSAHKYLLSFYGFGALWCRRAWAARMRPLNLGKPGVAETDAHPGETGYAVDLHPGARRFETHQTIVGAVALRRSVEYLRGFGTREIEAHVTGLAARLADGLAGLGLPVNRDPFDAGPTQVVTVGKLGADGLHGLSDPWLAAVQAHLEANGVRLSGRRGQLRFSFHLYNNEADVERVLALAEEALRRPEAARTGA